MPLTAVPQRTALSHAFGGLAAGLVGHGRVLYARLPKAHEVSHADRWFALVAEVILGFLTFTGSLMAAGKLQEVTWIPQRPVTYPFQNVDQHRPARSGGPAWVLVVILHPTGFWAGLRVSIDHPAGAGVRRAADHSDRRRRHADGDFDFQFLCRPVGVAMGFVLDNKLLITAGALDGSSGLILSIIMCRAMNRSFTNVLFGAFGQVQAAAASGEQRAYKEETVEGAAQILEQASLVVIIPGYGMAVAQAQHNVRELYDQLTKRGVTVKFAIHPVAGRMPGHMNVLLAEAEIPYSDLVEMDEINPRNAAVRRGPGDRRQRRRESGRAERQDQPDLRHADHRRRQSEDRLRHQAEQEPRFRRHRQRAVFPRQLLMLFGDAKAVVGELVKQFNKGAGH